MAQQAEQAVAGCGRVQRQQQQHAVADVGQWPDDAGLHVGMVERRLLHGQWRQVALPGLAQKPGGFLGKALAARDQQRLEYADALAQANKFEQGVARSAVQNLTIIGARQIGRRQAIDHRQGGKALSRGLGQRRRAEVAGNIPSLLFGALRGQSHLGQLRGQASGGICAALRQFDALQIGHIAHCQAGGAEEEIGLDLYPCDPGRPIFKAVVKTGDVVLGVAKNQVQKRSDALPQHPDVGLPTAIEADRQQDFVLGLQHRHAHRMNDGDAIHRV